MDKNSEKLNVKKKILRAHDSKIESLTINTILTLIRNSSAKTVEHAVDVINFYQQGLEKGAANE